MTCYQLLFLVYHRPHPLSQIKPSLWVQRINKLEWIKQWKWKLLDCWILSEDHLINSINRTLCHVLFNIIMLLYVFSNYDAPPQKSIVEILHFRVKIFAKMLLNIKLNFQTIWCFYTKLISISISIYFHVHPHVFFILF